jgi:hypothetical protein
MAIKENLNKKNSKKIVVGLIEKYKKVVDEKRANKVLEYQIIKFRNWNRDTK